VISHKQRGLWLLWFGWPGLVASGVGLFGAYVDIGPYFGSWFYILAIILLIQKRARLFNLGIFLAINALLFGIVTNQLFLGISLGIVAFVVIVFSATRLKRRLSAPSEKVL
jgi:hypothetical protein